MPPFVDRTGWRYSRLTVLAEHERRMSGKKAATFWKCRCDCGRELFVNVSNLISGTTRSCGCLLHARKNRLTHGLTGTPTYLAWLRMKQRCSDPGVLNYDFWGGRGIRVCDRWLHSFENFLADMGPIPGKGYSLDRVDNDGDYTPENCRWATRKEQNRNTRRNRLLTLNGETLCMVEWAERTGIPARNIRMRIDWYGWSVEKALTTPVQRKA